MHLDAGEPLPTKAGDVLRQGEDLGRRVQSVRLGWDQLTGVQQWMCEQVFGMGPPSKNGKPRPRPTQVDKSRSAHARQGPRTHVETVLSKDGGELRFRLGAWVNNQRGAAVLAAERAEQLSEVGMERASPLLARYLG
ncbi:helicase associated domain-containing protein [Streptomyces goshikiensis]|uniref:helicase associated domain-containing protein n=1 Tax=Streptomyces goshikiensis TaxID=1942 RepID=UPI0038197AF5